MEAAASAASLVMEMQGATVAHCQCRAVVCVLPCISTIREAAIAADMIHPHQRCGYSDLPFARKDTFLYCRV